MKLLDAYILKKILATFFFVLLILVAIVVVIDLAEKVDKFSSNNVSTSNILGYYRDFVPWIAGLLSPIIAFIATVYVTGRLAAHTELIAMLSSGISFPRLLYPYFLTATIIASITFVLNGWIIPRSNKVRLEFELRYLKGNQQQFDESHMVHMLVEPNVILYVQRFVPARNEGVDFTLERFQDNRLVDKVWADTIKYDTTKRVWTLRSYRRRLVDSLFYVHNPEIRNSIITKGAALDTAINIVPADFGNDQGKYDGMTIPELTQHINKLRFRGATGIEVFEVERQIRFAAPFTIFVLVFMGVLISARKSRGGTGFQIVLGFILAFVFLIFFLLTRTFAETGALAPWLAAWLPNIIFVFIAGLMYRYVPR